MASTWRIVAVTPERWPDLEQLFGPKGACAGCWCMFMRLPLAQFRRGKGEGNRRALRPILRRELAAAGRVRVRARTSRLVAGERGPRTSAVSKRPATGQAGATAARSSAARKAVGRG